MTGVGALLAALIMFGVTARLTRLITEDTITQPLRTRAVRAAVRRLGRDRAAGPAGKRRAEIVAEFVTCPWCVGLYIAFAVAVAVWVGERLLLDDPLLPLPGWLWVPGLALTNNYLTARLQT